MASEKRTRVIEAVEADCVMLVEGEWHAPGDVDRDELEALLKEGVVCLVSRPTARPTAVAVLADPAPVSEGGTDG